jgi:hypothetical protein
MTRHWAMHLIFWENAKSRDRSRRVDRHKTGMPIPLWRRTIWLVVSSFADVLVIINVSGSCVRFVPARRLRRPGSATIHREVVAMQADREGSVLRVRSVVYTTDLSVCCQNVGFYVLIAGVTLAH